MSNCVTVFVLGRPGSGKSTAAQLLNRSFAQQGWSTSHINDYSILQRMFLEDTEHRRFRPTENNGFDAIDLSVLDITLHEVEDQALMRQHTTHCVTIEFARDNYQHALKQFSTDFVRDAYFLFLDADLETCLQRVHKRVEYPTSTDDHPSYSDEVFRCYYQSDNRLYIENELQQDFQLRKKIAIISNTSSLVVYRRQVKQFAQLILKQENFPSLEQKLLPA
jgi:adenylate kinase family enzyme